MKTLIKHAIKKYLRKHFPREEKVILKRAEEIFPKLVAKAPNIGGKENSLASNLEMFLLFLSYYEATDHRMAGEAIDEIIADLYNNVKWLNGLMNINKKGILSTLRNALYKSYRKYAQLVGCPIADYAAKYGYMDLMPHMCALDHSYAKLMHAKLIRTHTVATGADSCDYWYVPDQSETAKNYKGIIV
ncbi:MAG: L-2-amino-thiazoline-4-carboxylic acid hydrolase [Lachnospiraceae bacterium]|nr:L-2-amino-thiazoline-4-carboxylic acid hydrolase [Lachnospiraceae bacterium]MBR4608622.1 L-2-amino-thiazoline-4-carboxylic acid hydrolase [Lachnospiraceae bacterium]